VNPRDVVARELEPMDEVLKELIEKERAAVRERQMTQTRPRDPGWVKSVHDWRRDGGRERRVFSLAVMSGVNDRRGAKYSGS
jgi:hypothetical protein